MTNPLTPTPSLLSKLAAIVAGDGQSARQLLAAETGLSALPNDPEMLCLEDRDQVFTEDALRAIENAIPAPPTDPEVQSWLADMESLSREGAK